MLRLSPAGEKITEGRTTHPFLLHQSLAHSMNEVGVSGGDSVLPHVTGNLPAMVGGVHEHMRQDVAHQAVVRLALAVFVVNGAIENVPFRQQISPALREGRHYPSAFVQREVRPNGTGRGSLPNAREPNVLSPH